MNGGDWSEFTEEAFRNLLRQLKVCGYAFARYGEIRNDRHVLWRHDVDFSLHRSARLAAIEAEEGALATYFVNPHCTFYNLAEPAVVRRLEIIAGLGHEIGLHFDAEAFPTTDWSHADLERAVERESRLLELITGRVPNAMSWHNPELAKLLRFDADTIGGLVNAYGATLRARYAYASDSNGYWRFKPMAEVIAEGHDRLQLLTHPAWWTPKPLAPSERIDRCIRGRAAAVRAEYDALLASGGRMNIGAAS